LTGLLVAAAGGGAYTFFPGTHAAPVADQLSTGVITAPASAGVLGSGTGSAFDQLPNPISTAIAQAPATRHKPAKPKPTPAQQKTTPPAAPSGSGGSGDAFGLGLYDGKSSPAGIETAAKWLGSSTSIKYAQDFIDATDWSHIENPWQLSNWKGSPFEMVWGVPMLPCGVPETQCSTNGSDYDLVASGGADQYFKTLAQNLVSNGFGTSYIRLGWEFNAGWMGWGICTEDNSALTSWAKDFVPAFRNIVTSMRSVSGENFKFIWNPIDSSNASCPGANLENFYPGDNYVDDISSDAYDGIGTATSDSGRWSDILNGVNPGGWTAVKPASINGQSFEGYGLTWLNAFAKAHGKEVGLPEWGLNTSGTNGGGGDDAYFVTQMSDWIKDNASGPAIFWNFGDGTLPLNIPGYTDGGTPDATAVFKSAFST
jgi:Glycosyl hydrolase family 26